MWCGHHTWPTPQAIGFCWMAPYTSVCLTAPWCPLLAVYHVVNSVPEWFTSASRTAWSLCWKEQWIPLQKLSCFKENKKQEKYKDEGHSGMDLPQEAWEFGKGLWSTSRKREGNVATMRPKQSRLHSASEVKLLLKTWKLGLMLSNNRHSKHTLLTTTIMKK